MKKLIFLLFLLLIACAPVATVPPTTTALPPSPTITPSPTATPNPTATPSAPREAEGGVQVFENGEWIELKAPEGIWGPVDGTKVVLVDDGEGDQEAYTQMKLENGFKDIDADEFVNVAKYNPDTKKWVLVPDITITRSPIDLDVHPSFARLEQGGSPDNINVTSLNSTLIGMKLENGSLSTLVLFRDRLFRILVDELGLLDVVNGQGVVNLNTNTPRKMGVSELVQMLDIINSDASDDYNDIIFNILWYSLPRGATLENCNNRLGLPSSTQFIQWCTSEFNKGENRPIVSKANIEGALLHTPNGAFVSELSEETNLSDLWAMTPVPDVDGTWVTIGLQTLR